jgi:hypothetical protein
VVIILNDQYIFKETEELVTAKSIATAKNKKH